MENWNSKKSKTRIRRRNSGIRKLILFAILLFLIIFMFIKLIIPGSITLARYVYTGIRSFYLSSKEFYFKSDKLSVAGSTFESSNWTGNNYYKVDITMSSSKNENEHSKSDIIYKIEYDYGAAKANGTPYPQNYVEFVMEDSNEQVINLQNVVYVERTIFMTSNYTDKFAFKVIPRIVGSLEDGDYIWVTIKATSTSPYVSELNGSFKMIIGTKDVTYKIEDEAYSPYAELIVTNEFDNYVSRDGLTNLTIDQYLNLQPVSERDNYYSKKITLDFDPTKVVLDTTSSEYIAALESSVPTDLQYTTITKTYLDNMGNQVSTTVQYVNHLVFYMGAEESRVIKFYKTDASQNYTYSSSSDYLVVTVNYT